MKGHFYLFISIIGVAFSLIKCPTPRVTHSFTSVIQYKNNQKNIENSRANQILPFLSRSALLISKQSIENKNDSFFIANFFKTLPIVSLLLAFAGIFFQVFVLYPWHEELSYELRDLERVVVHIDKVLESENRNVFETADVGEVLMNLKRPTGKINITLIDNSQFLNV